MPRGVKKALTMRHLQANDQMPVQNAPLNTPEAFLTEQEINDAMEPYVAKGMKLEVTDDHWFLTMVKHVRNQRGESIGSGPVTIQGNRRMPVRDLLVSADSLMVPLTPITPNPGV